MRKNVDLIEDYVCQHIGKEHPYLHQLYRDSNLYLVHGYMISGHIQGSLLHMLVALLKPKRILEIGTYTGYSALSMASALDEGCKIVTYEVNDEMEDFTRPRIDKSPWADKVDFRIGDVLDAYPKNKRTPSYNFIFMDGNKRQYVEYYEMAIDLLHPGGLLLADNTLWDGHVVEEAYNNDAQTRAIKEFNDLVAEDERVEKVILPIRDGLTLIRKI